MKLYDWECPETSAYRHAIYAYLLHSYCYYILDDPIISDELYDSLCEDFLFVLPMIKKIPCLRKLLKYHKIKLISLITEQNKE